MAIRYFKKQTPATKVRISATAHAQFSTVDHLWGYFATDSPEVHAAFEQAMREGRYAISEITAEEFTRDYIEKKNNGRSLKPLWREEFGRGTLLGAPLQSQVGVEAVQAAAGVAEVKGQPSMNPLVPGSPTVADPVPAPKPAAPQVNVGKRRKRSE